jgi:biliverdin reductase / flavin reductase
VEVRVKLAVFGATGGTGRELVERALKRGFEVVAPVRNPAALDIKHQKLDVIKGDVKNPAEVAAALSGCDAVVTSIGTGGLGTSRAKTTIFSDGLRNIVAGMQAHGIKRLVVISSVGVEDDPTEGFVYRYVIKRLLKNMYDDMILMEEIVKASDRDWTLVRPALLVDHAALGSYYVEPGGNVPGARTIARADLADFTLDQLGSDKHIGMPVGLAYERKGSPNLRKAAK